VDFALTDDQEAIRRSVRELAGRFDDDYWADLDRREEFPWAFYDAFAEAGWLGIAIPKRYGGSGLGVQEAALLVEEIAASGAGMNGCSALHLTIFGLNTLVRHGSEELRGAILPRAVDGSLHVCFGVTEPDAGTDTTRISTVARRDGGDYVITGRKVWITKAAESQRMVLIARTTPRDDVEKPTDGLSLFLIEHRAPTVHLEPIRKLGRNAVPSYEVAFDGHRVPASTLIGEEGQGFRYLLDGLNPERILLAAEALGMGRAAIRHAARYARERIVFDRPIGQNQGVAFPLADAVARLDAAELVIRNAAWRYDQALACGREANIAKYLAAEAGFMAADRAMQTLGGMGYATEYHVERYFREARILRLAPVSQELVLGYVAHHVLDLPRSY
jgi:acyl-CoA dehydrogenase